MKIGIDGRLWDESGVGRYIRNLVIGLADIESSNSFVLFCLPKDQDNIKKQIAKSKNSAHIKLVISNTRWHTVSEQWKFKEEIERQNVDLMHFTYFSYPAFYKRPFVITIHDLIIDHYPTGVASSLPLPVYKLKHYGYKKIVSSAVKNSEKIIVPSIATKDELINHYKADSKKINVIYEGFDPLISKGKEIKKVSENYILYIGNAYPHKNLPVLLEAFSILKKRTDIDLVCIGRDDFFYKKIESNAPDGVYFLHNIDDWQLFDYYRGARFFVMPSLMEGFGLPVLEAMSLSCPVLSSNTSALKEIAGDAALYFDPKNARDLADKMFVMLNDNKLIDELMDKGLKRSRAFSWEDCVTKTLKIYESCNSLRPGQ